MPRRYSKFRDAIKLVESAGVIVTIRRIAFIAGGTEKACKNWYYRELPSGRCASVRSGFYHRRQLRITRLRWIAKLRNNASMPMPLHVTALARDFGHSTKLVIMLLSSVPSLRAELGLRPKQLRGR